MGLNNEFSTPSWLIFDLETTGRDDAHQFVAPVSAPSNYTDPHKITAYEKTALAKRRDKVAVDPDLACIVAIAWTTSQNDRVFSVPAPDDVAEKLLLIVFFGAWSDLMETSPGDVSLSGFCIRSFDLPLIWRRAQFFKLDVPVTFPTPTKYPRAGSRLLDVADLITFNGTLTLKKQDDYCKIRGIEVDDSVQGKDIPWLVEQEDWPTITKHARADVIQSRALLLEQTGWPMPPAPPAVAEVTTDAGDVG